MQITPVSHRVKDDFRVVETLARRSYYTNYIPLFEIHVVIRLRIYPLWRPFTKIFVYALFTCGRKL